MIGNLFRQFLSSTPGELAFTIISTGTAYEVVKNPERVVNEPKDWIVVAVFIIIAVIAIFRTVHFLYNGRYLKGLKFNLYKLQKSLLLASSTLFLASVIFHLLR